MWRVLLDKLSLLNKLSKYSYTVKPICILCRSHLETIDHLFTSCPITVNLWDALSKHPSETDLLSILCMEENIGRGGQGRHANMKLSEFKPYA